MFQSAAYDNLAVYVAFKRLNHYWKVTYIALARYRRERGIPIKKTHGRIANRVACLQ